MILKKTTTLIQLQGLEASISIEEIQLVIINMKGNTSLGSEGITIEFYKTFVEELSAQLGILFNKILDEKAVLNSWKEADIVLIPKPYKDHRKVESFRLIALTRII